MPFDGRDNADATACDDCGALVPASRQNKHMQFHPHEPIADPCLLCHLPAGADVHEPEPTPASVHAMRRRVERDENQFA